MNAAPKEYDISPGARAALAKIFHLEYDLYNFLKQRLIGQVTEVCNCMPYKYTGDSLVLVTCSKTSMCTNH